MVKRHEKLVPTSQLGELVFLCGLYLFWPALKAFKITSSVGRIFRVEKIFCPRNGASYSFEKLGDLFLQFADLFW